MKKIQILKEKKKQKNMTEWRDHDTQIEKLITEEDTKRYIYLEDKALMIKIEEIVMIKNEAIQNGKNLELVCSEIHPML